MFLRPTDGAGDHLLRELRVEVGDITVRALQKHRGERGIETWVILASMEQTRDEMHACVFRGD